MPKIDTFSAYMLKTFDECQKKFDLQYIQKITMPSDAKNAALGDKIHLLANLWLKNEDTKKFEQTLNAEELRIFGNFKNLEILNTECLESEYPFSVKLGKIYLNGRMDAVFKNGDKITIADWKTGKKFQDENDYQAMIYLFSLYQIFQHKKINLPPENFEFVYFYLNSNETLRINYNKETLSAQTELLKNKTEQILSTKNFTPDTKQCYTCNYKCLCYNYSNKGMYLKSV